jgi:hypothetical protein
LITRLADFMSQYPDEECLGNSQGRIDGVRAVTFICGNESAGMMPATKC